MMCKPSNEPYSRRYTKTQVDTTDEWILQWPVMIGSVIVLSIEKNNHLFNQPWLDDFTSSWIGVYCILNNTHPRGMGIVGFTPRKWDTSILIKHICEVHPVLVCSPSREVGYYSRAASAVSGLPHFETNPYTSRNIWVCVDTWSFLHTFLWWLSTLKDS